MADDLNVGSLPLGDHDSDWLRVMAAATGSSVRVKVASVCGYYVRRRKEEYKAIIEYTARKYGLTFSECFQRLRKGESLGTALPDFEVDYEIEGMIERLKDSE